MEGQDRENKELINQARELVKQLEEGNYVEAGTVIDQLTGKRENKLYVELGKLTRELHETLTSLIMDSNILAIKEHDIPDARECLEYIITMTEQSANRTLNAVEETIPIAEAIQARSSNVNDMLSALLLHDAEKRDYRALGQELNELLPWIIEQSSHIHKQLSDVIIAQEFQDLTGQIVRRVITTMQHVEESLVNLIRISNSESKGSGGLQAVDRSDLGGPRLPSNKNKNRMSSQDDVDELLSNLGF